MIILGRPAEDREENTKKKNYGRMFDNQFTGINYLLLFIIFIPLYGYSQRMQSSAKFLIFI